MQIVYNFSNLISCVGTFDFIVAFCQLYHDILIDNKKEEIQWLQILVFQGNNFKRK